MFTKRGAITFILISYCIFLFPQTTTFSRDFASIKSHVPIQIVNSNSQTFLVLRYNKSIHDFTVERRKKSNFEIISFTALKLDSINANWFDYENLDYLFFEQNQHAYFVFEKVLNEKKTIYIKQIDSLGKSTVFKELASIDKDEKTTNFRFIFKRDNSSGLLIVGEHYYQNATAKKVVLVYDLNKSENKYIIKLPLENPSTGFSQAFECSNNQLYYLLSNSYLSHYRKFYTVNQEILRPVYNTRILSLACFNLENKSLSNATFCNKNTIEIKSANVSVLKNQVTVFLNYAADLNVENKNSYFLSECFDTSSLSEKFCKQIPLESNITKQLTFYDSGDKAEASEKNYQNYQSFYAKNYFYQFCERKEENYFKEILFWKTNIESGEIIYQKVLPRKIFFYDDRFRFKHINEVAIVEKDETIFAFLLEKESNAKLDPNHFNFHRYKKQKYLRGGNLVVYETNANGESSRKLIYKNGNYSAVPLKYNTNQKEFIYYLIKGKTEKFAILTL